LAWSLADTKPFGANNPTLANGNANASPKLPSRELDLTAACSGRSTRARPPLSDALSQIKLSPSCLPQRYAAESSLTGRGFSIIIHLTSIQPIILSFCNSSPSLPTHSHPHLPLARVGFVYSRIPLHPLYCESSCARSPRGLATNSSILPPRNLVASPPRSLSLPTLHSIRSHCLIRQFAQ